MECIILKDRSS